MLTCKVSTRMLLMTCAYTVVKVAQLSPTLCDPMEFSRPEYWSGYPFPSPGDLPNPRIKPRSPALQVDSLWAEPQGKLKNAGVGSLSLSPGDLPNPGSELESPALQADSLPAELPGKLSYKYTVNLAQCIHIFHSIYIKHYVVHLKCIGFTSYTLIW